jgi:alpha-N-acetylglucosamine transferase
MSKNAFVTLLTNDYYLPGALVLAKSLRKQQTIYPICILATKNQISPKVAKVLEIVFDFVYWVDAIHSSDKENLELLGRPELGITFTKIHCFNKSMLPFEKVAFLDADTFCIQNIDSIFDHVNGDVEFAAAPDIGWPDNFNSGVFVTRPSQDLFERLCDHASTRGSFDGIDN